MYECEVLADSISPAGKRLTTVVITYPRMVHAELLTHRMFCLAGDSMLEFELPAGQGGGTQRRVQKMTIADFVAKWVHGSAPHRTRWGTERTYDLKSRLREMRIRQLNEATGEIHTATVDKACESGLKPVYELTAENYRIAGSADHRVMTDDGWKTIGEIRIGDALVVSTRKKPQDLKMDPLRLKKINGRWRSTWQREQRERLLLESELCRKCQSYPGEEIHHIVPVHQDPSRAFDDTNVTLYCDGCHKLEHAKQGWQEGNLLYTGFAIVDGIKYRGVEPTYDLAISGPFPNFLANKVVVHNSRNSASSRAIPNEKLRERVINDPALPVWWGKNQSGMQAREELSEEAADVATGLVDAENNPVIGRAESPRAQAMRLWIMARDKMLAASAELAEMGLHKQLCNRLIEPWMGITVIISATEWENFFKLRCHPDAQPEIRVAAETIREKMDASNPEPLSAGEWHLPLVREEDWSAEPEEHLVKLSVARCARVSYLTHDGRRDAAADFDLYARLATSGHWSPFEHAAMATEEDVRYGNFIGWKQHRAFVDPNFIR